MNFLIVGQSVVDKIIEEGSISVKPGGIFYAVVSMLSQAGADDYIYLCSSIDKQNEKLFELAYSKIKNDFLFYVDLIPQVELKVDGICERKETYSLIAQNLNLPVENLNSFDGILINMISGYDISLNQLTQLRKNYNGLIYFDVHTMSRGADENLNRVFRRIEDFNYWALCTDILQTNESEILTLSDKRDETAIVEELFSFGIRQVIITRAEKGATVFYKENDSVKKIYKDALMVKAVNKVGCGDVFGAVYFFNYTKNKNVPLALEQANLFAGIAATLTTTDDFLKLKKYANEWISKK
jgi:sugar/nucleoside kinase (ribokinase family)